MARRLKAVQLLVNSQLPEELRDEARSLDAGGIGQLMSQVALTHPDRYAEILKSVGDIGRNAAYTQGETLTLDDMRPVLDRKAIWLKMDAEIAEAKKQATSPADFKQLRERIWLSYADSTEKQTLQAALASGSNLGQAIASGARGKASHLKMMVTSPGVYTDAEGKLVPMYVKHSFGQGLRPAEYLAGMYGARQSVLATKNATAAGGYFSKTMSQAASSQPVTMKDCGTTNGIDLDIGDESLRHRVLAVGGGGMKPGTILDRHGVAALKKSRMEAVIVRSPLTCQAKEGICAKCAGADPTGKLYSVGESIGITAANALGEPITQGALNCLVEGTKVRMADGTVKLIEDIEVGDLVLGACMSGDTFPSRVVAKWDQGMQPAQRYTFDKTNQVVALEATAAHPVLSALSHGDHIKLPAAECQVPVLADGYYARHASTTQLGLRQCWDISVDNEDELFVLANRMIVKNTKHTGGIAGGKREYSGFDVINQFAQSPEVFENRATVAEADGVVKSVTEAPQGGHYIHVGDTEHYVPAGFEVMVKPGEEVEAGDPMADGLMDPGDVVRLKGLGAGRRYYSDRLKKILDDSGMKADRRNTEMLARSVINHVEVDDDDSLPGTLPGDTISYESAAAAYIPPEDTRGAAPGSLLGQYLQAPALHYSIGTRVTPKVAKHLTSRGFDKVYASASQPGFSPGMVRLQTAAQANSDWVAQQNTSHLGGLLNDSAVRGADTDVGSNVNFAPRLAIGVDFGKDIATTGKF